ncbi:MAG TPA: hypothetical protein VFW96_02195, partial [Thermomicrobiales bacterium]|nr:hypothetical protein [Thermomicrobiales bacterium]
MSGDAATAARDGKRGITAEDLYRFTYVADPRVSPDGARVAFVRTTIDREANAYRSRIWVAPSDGSAPPRPFTAGPSDTAPRWSPDGRWLAFLRKRGEKDAKPQLWVLGARGGEGWQLTEVQEGAADPQWSPDSARVAFTSKVSLADEAAAASGGERKDEPKSDVKVIDRIKHRMDGEGFYGDKRRHLFVAPVRDLERAEARQLTFGDYNEVAPVWSPDGRSLACASARHDDRDFDNKGDIWVIAVDEEHPEPRRVTRTTGPCAAPVFSPDGATIAYTGHDNQPDYGPTTQTGLWVVPADGSAPPRNLTAALDRPVGGGVGTDSRYGAPDARPIWTPDGAALLCLLEDEGRGGLVRVDIASGETAQILGGERQITNADRSADGARLAYAASDGLMPADIFTADARGAGERRLTDSNGALFAEVELRAPERHRYRAEDGQALD